MATPCLEIVMYKIVSSAGTERQRAAAMKQAQALRGFVDWLPLTGCQGSAERADMVVWASHQTAEDAAHVVRTAGEFAPFRASIAELGCMGHFALPTGGLPMMCAGEGVELGRFRQRAGVTDTALRAAHARMIETHLS